MALRNTTRMGSLALTLLVAGCGEEDSDTEPVDGPATNGRAAIQARALDEYATRDATRTHCDDVSTEDEDEEGAEAPTLTDDEVLLLDAAPQCDLERLGLTDTDNIVEGRIIERANVADEPALALCSCTELEASNRIMAPGQSDIIGDLGANERVFGSAPISVDGMVISGATARFDNTFRAASLRVDGVLTASNEVTIHNDAVLGGIDVPGTRINVGGTLTVPEGTDLSSVESSEEVVFESVDVVPPCDCSQDVDYDALRDRFRDHDEDGVDDYDHYDDYAADAPYLYPAPPYLLNDLSEDQTVYLGCGSYYFEGIQSAAALTLVAVGDVDVFVDGDVEVAGPLDIQIDDEASLDLFVAGTFNPTNTVDVGDTNEPNALRMYVRDEVRLAGPFVFSGALFAPNAAFIANNTFENQGGVFAERLDFAGPIQVTNGPRFTRDACLIWDETDGESD